MISTTDQPEKLSNRDNEAFRALFTLPPAQASTAIAKQDLPPVQNVTGDQEVDAVLWLRQVISTGSPDLIAKAKEAIKRIQTPMKVLEERYNNYQRIASIKTGVMNFIFGFGDLDGLARSAIEIADRRHQALARFGTEEALFSEQPSEAACRAALRGLKTPRDDLESYDYEKTEKRFLKRFDLTPCTLADCLHAIEYWNQLYWLRNAVDRDSSERHPSAWEHLHFCRKALAKLTPRSKAEALSVVDHAFSDSSIDHEDEEKIMRHLVASGWASQASQDDPKLDH